MITTFEDYTIELTDQETAIARVVAKKLSHNVGKTNAVTNKMIRKAFEDADGLKLGDAQVRKIIQFIILEDLVGPLCAWQKGYFIAQNRKELEDHLKSLDERINAIKAKRFKLEKYLHAF